MAAPSLLLLTNLISQVASFPDDQAEVHAMVLPAILTSLGGPARGWLGVDRAGTWVRTAGEGRLRFDPAAGGTVRSRAGFLVGRVEPEGAPMIGLQVELLDAGDAAQARTAFKVGLDVLAAYEAIREVRLRSRSFQDQTQQLLDLATALGSRLYSTETFYAELLRAAMAMIGEATAGSIAQLQDGEWRYVAAVGHDEAALKGVSLPAGALAAYPAPTVVDRLLDREPGSVAGVRRILAEASLPIARTLIVTLEIQAGFQVNVALDITGSTARRFSPGSVEIFGRLCGLIRSFLQFRSQKEQTDRANRRLTEKLALLAEAHDLGTAEHNRRVARISVRLAQTLGLDELQVDQIREGAILHDIGKLFLDPQLLNKKARLTDEERHRLQQHTLWAERLLDDPYFSVDQKIAVYHHERYDGLGYPKGLAGDEIPFVAQIVSVADVYDALRSPRAYKEGFDRDEALRRMVQGDDRMAAGAFHPEILAALVGCAGELEEIYQVQSASV